jgi:sulfide:quinone oxidoreductase
MPDRRHAPFHVLVAGGGPAAIEGALTLQLLAEDRVRITLLAPDAEFRYRPLAVAEPFALGRVARFSLPRLAAERGFSYVHDALSTVDVPARRVHTAGGETIDYDALLIAVGAHPEEALPGALTFRGSQDTTALREALERLNSGIARVAFVAAPATVWTLPLYELALMTARWADQQQLGVETWLVTHEARALGVFGDDVAVRIAELLEDAGVRLWTGAFADCVEDGRLWLDLEGGLPVALAVALPRPVGPHIPGLPADEEGFLAVDAEGRVENSPGVYAAGDVTTRPLRQGGLATQQAEAAATAIALQAGAPVEAAPYHPTLRGMLLTGRRPQYLTRTPGWPGEATDDSPWWPPHKIAGRHLGPYLAAHPELREYERTEDASVGTAANGGELRTGFRERSGCRIADAQRSPHHRATGGPATAGPYSPDAERRIGEHDRGLDLASRNRPVGLEEYGRALG